MKRRDWITISAAGFTVALVAAADDRVTLRRRLKCVPGIPTRDYDDRSFSPTFFAISGSAVSLGPFPAVSQLPVLDPRLVPLKGPVIATVGVEALATSPAVPAPGLRAKMYQFIDPTFLGADQCRISEMAAVIDEGGQWVVSLRADQNPADSRVRNQLIDQVVVDDVRRSVLQTSHILRNRFHVRVFGYAAPATLSPTPGLGVTDPAVFEADIPPFWVQAGRSTRKRWTGTLDPGQAARAFALVDRIGIEFSYEVQPGLRPDRP